MRTINSILLLLCLCTVAAAQHEIKSPEHHHGREDSTDVFFRHMKLNELVVTGVTGDTKLKNSTAPISIINPRELRSTAAANVIDAIARQPGMSQLTTGSGISKPIIRGLGYNRVVVMSEGVRQEGQQWGDEHGIEVDGSAVNSVEILKGPASLMYGSDAMAGVVILHSAPTLAEGELQGNVSTEYQTNNGLFAYTLSMAGNQRGFVWDARFSDKMAHQYKNKYDGYVPGSQFHERAGRLMLGLNKQWGHSRLTWTAYHLTPSIIEGERDEATGVLTSHLSPLTSYSKSLPFQQVKHYKLVWDNALNLPSGYLKAIVGYQQNRRQEFEEEEGEEQGARGKEQGARGEGSEVRGDECLEPSLFFKMHTLTYDVRYLTSEWDGWKLSAGIGGMYQQSLNKGEEYLIPDYRLFDFGLYATVSKTLDRWTLNGGLRYDHRFLRGEGQGARGKEQGAGGEEQEGEELRFPDFSRHFNGVTGSVGAVWNASDHLNLRLNIARGFRTPNMSELASNGIHEGSLRYEVGNQQLKAEYSLQADLGLDFTSQYVSAQLALFANRIDNYIFLRGEERGARGKGRGLSRLQLYAGRRPTAGLRGRHRLPPRPLAAPGQHVFVCRRPPAAPARRHEIPALHAGSPLDVRAKVGTGTPRPYHRRTPARHGRLPSPRHQRSGTEQCLCGSRTGVLPPTKPRLQCRRHRDADAQLHAAEPLGRHRHPHPGQEGGRAVHHSQQPAEPRLPESPQPTEICGPQHRDRTARCLQHGTQRDVQGGGPHTILIRPKIEKPKKIWLFCFFMLPLQSYNISYLYLWTLPKDF